jgi:hypothetical protein
MTVAPARTQMAVARSGAYATSRRLADAALVGGVVLAATLLRVVTGLLHASPRYFPDEYIYPTLAQSLLHGKLEVRGEPARFPAILESIVTAPLWLADGIETSYRLTQGLHALAAALIAVPVFAIARRLELPRWQCIGSAAVAVSVPPLLFANYLTADALGGVLAVSAIAVGLTALVERRSRYQAAFLALSAAATLARVQYVVLVPAFVVAALVVERFRPWRAARRYPIVAGVLAVCGLAALVLGPTRLLGYYSVILDQKVDLPLMAKWGATDALMLALSAGVLLAAPAAVGLVAALARPQWAVERAFAALAAAFIGFVLLEATFYASNGALRFQERYFVSVLPLVPLLACLGFRHAGSKAARIGLVAVGIAVVAALARLPLTDYARDLGDQDSFALKSVTSVTEHMQPGQAALLFALTATALAVLGVVLAFARERFAVVALFGTVCVLLVVTATAMASEEARSHSARGISLADDKRWVDHAGVGDVSYLVTENALRWVISEQLFWNRKLTRVLTMPGAPEADAFQNTKVNIGADGVLREHGRPVDGPLLVSEYATLATLEGARLVTRQAYTSLWETHGGARFALLTDGRYLDAWLAWPESRVTIWPKADGPRHGVLCLRFSLPDTSGDTRLLVRAPGGVRRSVPLAANGAELVALPMTVARKSIVRVGSTNPVQVGPRLLSVRLAPPRFVEGPVGPQGAEARCR